MTKDMDDLTEELGAYIESLKREIADLKTDRDYYKKLWQDTFIV